MTKLLIFIALIGSFLHAVVYESAENLSTGKWTCISPSYVGEITNDFDTKKNSRIIKFKGFDTKSIYLLPLAYNASDINFSTTSLEWEMNYKEDFVVIIELKTTKGTRQVFYTSGKSTSHLQYGLGLPLNKWRKQHRNIEKDLQRFEKNNKLLAINSFVIKGSGKIDNIKINSRKKVPIRALKVVPVVVVPKKVKTIKLNTSKVPVIMLNGKNPLFLEIGEEYVELGAISKNRDGSNIEIIVTHDIDVLTQKEYSVIYIATNKLGNSAIDKRRVIVGKVIRKKEPKVLKEEEVSKTMIKEIDATEKREKEEAAKLEKEELAEAEEKDERTHPIRPGL